MSDAAERAVVIWEGPGEPITRAAGAKAA